MLAILCALQAGYLYRHRLLPCPLRVKAENPGHPKPLDSLVQVDIILPNLEEV